MAGITHSLNDYQIFLNGRPVKKVTSYSLFPKRKFQKIRNLISKIKYKNILMVLSL